MNTVKNFHYYSFVDKVSVSNKTKDLILSMFNKTTGKRELKPLTKYISSKCKCKFMDENVIQINGGIMVIVPRKTW